MNKPHDKVRISYVVVKLYYLLQALDAKFGICTTRVEKLFSFINHGRKRAELCKVLAFCLMD